MKNIIITGGGFGNKGAEAMTYIAVAELKKKFPLHTIYLYIPEQEKIAAEKKSEYAFELLGWNPIKFAKAQRNLMLKVLCTLKNGREFSACNSVYKNTELMVDISGYALGSNWSGKICSDYLDNIAFAHAYGIPVYLMPQSFGPFDFIDETGKKIDRRAALLLPEVKKIYAREKEGYDYLVQHYQLKNVELKTDIVLSNPGIDYQYVFQKMPNVDIPNIVANSVCVIPNDKVYEFCCSDAQDIYTAVISELLSFGKTVYLMYHSTADRERCVSLKNRFQDDPNVVLLDKDYSCIEFNEIVKQFQYIVGSRFHSIVHAFKNGVPCLSLGWAVKYHDLLETFSQQQYAFDFRSEIDETCLLEKLHNLDENRERESATIKRKLEDLQRDNVFDLLSL